MDFDRDDLNALGALLTAGCLVAQSGFGPARMDADAGAALFAAARAALSHAVVLRLEDADGQQLDIARDRYVFALMHACGA